MSRLVPGIHLFAALAQEIRGWRDESGHDEKGIIFNWLEETENPEAFSGSLRVNGDDVDGHAIR